MVVPTLIRTTHAGRPTVRIVQALNVVEPRVSVPAPIGMTSMRPRHAGAP